MWYIIYKNSKGVTTMRKELLKGLTDEQVKKVKACKSQEEILELAKTEGVELNEEQLAAVSGGLCSESSNKCPNCGSTNVKLKDSHAIPGESGGRALYICKDCKHTWVVD